MEICHCGIKYRQMFKDVFTCPRCNNIIVWKDGIKLVWSGKIAAVLLDQAELYVTKILLEHRHECDRIDGPPAPVDDDEVKDAVGVVPSEAAYRRMLLAAGKKVTGCVNCTYPVEDKCGSKCLNCKTIQPCSREGT